MKHIYQQGTNGQTLLLLHGTGGNEYDLLPLAKMIDPEANVLSVRGNVLEYGMPRFFKRLAMGVFDMGSLVDETHNLFEFLHQASQDYGFDASRVCAVGYSNGANIAASVLLHFDHPFQKAILFHPMVPIRNLPKTDLSHTQVFIGAGKTDHLMKPEEVEELEALFRYHQAFVTVYWTNHGHQLNKEEIDASIQWYHHR